MDIQLTKPKKFIVAQHNSVMAKLIILNFLHLNLIFSLKIRITICKMPHKTEEKMKINDEIPDDTILNLTLEELNDVEECGMSTMKLDDLFVMFK
jgi:hypothetical protein